jgi:glutathione peroxidase
MDFYDLNFTDTRNNTIRLSDYRGKVLLIVNTATKCGLAPQFEEMEKMHQKYKGKNFSVIGFPCNQFLNQEPESDETMVSACKINFGVTFLLSKKIAVNGKNTHPVFVYLKKALPDGVFGNRIKWNFTKFLVAADGKPYKRYAPTVQPFALETDIVKLLETSRSY